MAFLTDVFVSGRESFNLAGVRRRWNDYMRRRDARRTTIRELSGLTDRELADLGISRFQIKEVAAEAARRA